MRLRSLSLIVLASAGLVIGAGLLPAPGFAQSPPATAPAALSKVSRAKSNKDLDEPTKKRLEDEFKQLMERVKATAPPQK